MAANRQCRRDAQRLFRRCFEGDQLQNDRVRAVAAALAASSRRQRQSVLAEFLKRVRLWEQARAVRIESAVPLDDVMKASLERQLPGAEFRHNPALLGGLFIRSGWTVMDGSVARRLRDLAERL
jgi:F0F1-type ATP synthase delta subunit